MQNDQEEAVETLILNELFCRQWSNDPPSPKCKYVTSPTPSDPEIVTSHFHDVDQPLQEFHTTESFWDDYLQQDAARSLEPVNHT